MYDLVIIGGGPAGITAALYAQRAGLKNVLIEKMYVGGQVVNTYEIDNYPGIPSVNGVELMQKMEKHLKSLDGNIIFDEVKEIDLSEKPIFNVVSKNEIYKTKSVIISTGAKPRKLMVRGEEEFTGRGVSYCATCDGAFYKDKSVAVLGSGNTAAEDAIFLSKLCEKVYLISRSDRFKCDKNLLIKIKELNNIELMNNFITKEIMGENLVNKIVLKNVNEDNEKELSVSGVFVAIGVVPNTNLLENIAKKDSNNYFVTDKNMETTIKGIFACGDARDTPLKQIITACSDGAIASFSALKFISELS